MLTADFETIIQQLKAAGDQSFFQETAVIDTQNSALAEYLRLGYDDISERNPAAATHYAIGSTLAHHLIRQAMKESFIPISRETITQYNVFLNRTYQQSTEPKPANWMAVVTSLLQTFEPQIYGALKDLALEQGFDDHFYFTGVSDVLGVYALQTQSWNPLEDSSPHQIK